MRGLVLAKMNACNYYGPHATGAVLLVNGSAVHFTGQDSAERRNSFMRRLIARKKREVLHD